MANKNVTNYKKTASIKEGLLRAFPTTEEYFNFKKNDHKISSKAIPKVIEYSNKYEIIFHNIESDLIHFIETNNSLYLEEDTTNFDITFETIIKDVCKGFSKDNRKVLSSNNLVVELNKVALNLGMPEIKATMLSRLKNNYVLNTEKKRALIRVLSFWIGYRRPHLPWNYISLLKLAQTPQKKEIPENEGVRIDFSFEKSGEIIDYKMMQWLVDELKQCILDLYLYPKIGNKIEFTSTTTATININKNSGPSHEPRLYSDGIRHSLAIAHQIIVRWALAEENKNKSSIIIGIAAGNYTTLSVQLQTLLSASLPENPSIRLTDFTRLCVRTTDAKIIFTPEPILYKMSNGETLNIWSIKYFWFLYYDFIPCLLEEDMLPVFRSSYKEFRELIYFPEHPNQSSKFKVIQAIRQFPQNSLLAIEAAKVCLSRRMFSESKLILSNTFALDPFNPVARTLQMIIYLNMAMEQKDPSLFDVYYDRAKKEGDFILSHCLEEEEIWCEYGLLHWTKAFYTLKRLRTGLIDDEQIKIDMFNSLKDDIKKAETSFQKGIMFSPTLHRPGFWIIHLQSLHMMLESGNHLFQNTLITDSAGIYAVTSLYFYISFGWIEPHVLKLTDEEALIEQLNMFSNRVELAIDTYYGSAQLKMYKPNVAYAIASVLWDFSPIITVRLVKKVIFWLEEAKRQAEKLLDINIGIMSIVSWSSQIQPPENFIHCVNKSIHTIQQIVKDDLDNENDFVIDNAKLKGMKLFTAHFSEQVDSGPLYANRKSLE